MLYFCTVWYNHTLLKTHTVSQGLIKRSCYHVVFLCTSWVLLEQQLSLHCHAGQGIQGSMVFRLIFMPGLSDLEIFHNLLFYFVKSLNVGLRLWSCAFVMLLPQTHSVYCILLNSIVLHIYVYLFTVLLCTILFNCTLYCTALYFSLYCSVLHWIPLACQRIYPESAILHLPWEKNL